MNSKQSIAITAIAVIAFLMIGATTFASPDDALAKKSCAKKKWSHCKGTKGWYTKHGHHHCFKGESKDCVNTKYHD
ncbi:MAG: hypothetical protein ACTHKF_10900 [Candidatus Nitrosocosmicus sp.]